MKVYDPVLKQEVEVHRKVPSDVECEIVLEEPASFAKIFEPQEDAYDEQ